MAYILEQIPACAIPGKGVESPIEREEGLGMHSYHVFTTTGDARLSSPPHPAKAILAVEGTTPISAQCLSFGDTRLKGSIWPPYYMPESMAKLAREKGRSYDPPISLCQVYRG